MDRDLVRNVQKNPHITAKELQRILQTTKIYMAGLAERTTIIKHLKHANENIEKPEAFWSNVLWTDETKMELCETKTRNFVDPIWKKMDTGKEGMFGEKMVTPL